MDFIKTITIRYQKEIEENLFIERHCWSESVYNICTLCKNKDKEKYVKHYGICGHTVCCKVILKEHPLYNRDSLLEVFYNLCMECLEMMFDVISTDPLVIIKKLPNRNSKPANKNI